jgi:hypothetical protein
MNIFCIISKGFAATAVLTWAPSACFVALAGWKFSICASIGFIMGML